MIFMFVKTVNHQQQLRQQQLQPLQRLHQCRIRARDMVKSVPGEFAIVILDMKVINAILKIVKISWQDQTADSGKYSNFQADCIDLYFEVNANWTLIRRKCIAPRKQHCRH